MMGLVKDGVKGMGDLRKGLKKEKGDRSLFLWNFIEGQIKNQPDDVLVDLRKLINKTLKDKRIARKCKENE